MCERSTRHAANTLSVVHTSLSEREILRVVYFQLRFDNLSLHSTT